jgi:RHS repeat-associated protein
VDALIERDRGSERLYAQQDANWDVTAVVDTTGAVQERYMEDPYGQVTYLTPAWSSRGVSSYAWAYLHQGGRYEAATGLYYFRHRDYSPVLGRWMEVDPKGYIDGANLYSVERDDPVNHLDPAGLWRTTFPYACWGYKSWCDEIWVAGGSCTCKGPGSPHILLPVVIALVEQICCGRAANKVTAATAARFPRYMMACVQRELRMRLGRASITCTC